MTILPAVITVGVIGLTVQKYIDTRGDISSAMIRQFTVSVRSWKIEKTAKNNRRRQP